MDGNASGHVTRRNSRVQSGGQSIKHSGLSRIDCPDEARVSGHRHQIGHRQGIVSNDGNVALCVTNDARHFFWQFHCIVSFTRHFFWQFCCIVLWMTHVTFFDSSKAMRHKVWTARNTSPLFDCKIYAEGLELLYSKMWERFANGLKPDHITDTTVKKWP